jgi:activator of HSP90 ATPase
MNRQNWSAMAVEAPTRRQLVTGAVLFSGLHAAPISAWTDPEDGIYHRAESIHQEPVFQASRKRVYEALTDAKRFGQVEQLSAAMQSGASRGNESTAISRQVGGVLRLFNGHIVGRQIELVPEQRIIQAWRVVDWNPGIYSIARFELTERGSGTKIVFDHTGFPEGKAQHLASGWIANYWEPLRKYLA